MASTFIKIYPSIGDCFYIKHAVSDTQSLEQLTHEVDMWLDENISNIEQFDFAEGLQTSGSKLQLCFLEDADGNPFAVDLPESFSGNDKDVLNWVTTYFNTIDYQLLAKR